MGSNAWISQYVYLDEIYPEAISIGDNCTIGLRTTIIAHLHWGPRRPSGGYRSVVVEDDVFIGPHCLVLPGVKIGRGSVIKGGSVLSRSVRPRSLVGPPTSERQGAVAVPLTAECSYEEFLGGLRIDPPDDLSPWKPSKPD